MSETMIEGGRTFDLEPLDSLLPHEEEDAQSHQPWVGVALPSTDHTTENAPCNLTLTNTISEVPRDFENLPAFS